MKSIRILSLLCIAVVAPIYVFSGSPFEHTWFDLLIAFLLILPFGIRFLRVSKVVWSKDRAAAQSALKNTKNYPRSSTGELTAVDEAILIERAKGGKR